VVVGVATLAWVTLLAGFVASRVRDVGLQAKGPFASSARIWLPMGLSSLVFPVVVASAFWLIVKALAFVDQRSGAHLGLGSPWRKLRRDDTVHDSAIRLSVVHGACAVIAVCLFFRFILAVFAFSAQGEPSTYRLLAPDMLKLHVTYRFTWTCIVAVFVPGWAVIASRLVSEKQVRSGVQTLVLGFLLCSASIALWALPYQILWQSSYARVRYGLDACYAVARAFEQELLFCPVTSDPVNRFQVVAADALPQRRQGPCNIFTDLGPAPGAVACRD
jgi:hypothetical protein